MDITVIQVPGHGAEDVVVATSGPDEGAVYTGTEDGMVLRISHDGRRIDRIAETGGRPLGIELFDDGSLLVCDAHAGLLRLDPRSGRLDTLADAIDGVPFAFCNNAAVATNGDIWFSDSSTLYGIEEWKDDLVQHTRTGRLLRLDACGELEVVLDGLAFANGVALGADETWVVVAETGARTLVRHWISGEREGEREVMVADLPGYPDNIARGSDGLIWVSIASPTDPVVERLQRSPMPLRRAATRIPEALQPKPKRTVRAQAYDEHGTLVRDLDLDTPDFHMVTGVREHEGRVWLGSLHEPAIAIIDA
ncbi:SMP-30/gluconolactonase/LRE family protein [Nocardioides sp. AE5]|uniref:SMP-30/gluconolactonase/LRE family protein n=1 Tax=Nocardioides sp. AE5 TaxID=2962573 RepID=UPI0028829919|nr:SMP-30/gluconolactonase/LRE family protein [Nocardioides sp. AE5]MDT0201398.1 SMP-30/gluconolactonase/LRE family protein [Nocardioides sp. AE5]